MEGAALRWAGATRLDDADLYRRIGYEFGVRGGYCADGVWVEYHGGTNPSIEIRAGNELPARLAGTELLAAVRDALGLARPGELF